MLATAHRIGNAARAGSSISLTVMGSRRRRGAALASGAISIALLAGCVAESPMPTPEPTASFVSSYEAPPPFDLAPLTGEVVEVGSATAPAFAAKIDNHPDARPQVGLDRADVVWEILVEGGLTRYIAVWQSDIPDEIGPIRSVRPVDPSIVAPQGGIIAYSGGQSRFVVAMQQAPVYNAIHGQRDTADTMFRGQNAPAPHNVLVRATQIVAEQSALPAPPQQFAFAESIAAATATKEGAATTRIDLRIGGSATPAWVWSADQQSFLRYMTGGRPDVATGGAQLTAVNVVTLRVSVQVIQSIPTVNLIGQGEAWVSTGGATVPATWIKSSLTDPIRLIDANGVAVRLAPGNTWVELVPLGGAVSFTAPVS
jgi:hypothetical protein